MKNTHRTTELFRVYEAERAVWKKQNNIGLSYIISACGGEKNKIAMQIVSEYITQQEAAGGIPKTATLVDMLEKRFHGRSIQIIQGELASFNSINLQNGELGESFIDRILEAKSRFAAYGRQLDNEIDLLGRLKAGLRNTDRYNNLVLTMKAQTDMTWEKATDMVINMDLIDAKNQKSSSNASKDQVNYICGSRWCDNWKKTNH